MTQKQIDVLKEYIASCIDEANDKGDSSDEGLTSSIRKLKAEKELDLLLNTETES